MHEKKRPNVLLICVDHWPGLLMGAAGNGHILTPTLDQLCANGVRFSQAYSQTPTCIPARRALMTGLCSRTHGDRTFMQQEFMPTVPTLPQCFRDAGYQAYAVGKLHVYPQRDRIGFDEVILNEEGRHHLGGPPDDYELFLKREGYAGQELTHAMGNNAYTVRPWHLPEYTHPTTWAVREMCNVIDRRDPTRPAFWYLSFVGPHPPITPLQEYLDLYRDLGVDEPYIGDWAQDPQALPYAMRMHMNRWPGMGPREIRLLRQGFYAQCTHIDHQLRLVIGKLREEGELDNTIIMLTCDHGDMLGNHNLVCKPPMYEYSAKIPMLLVDTAAYARAGHHQVDDRLAELQDVMPTLLDLCDIPIPEHVEGNSLVSSNKRDYLYCEHFEDDRASRMIRRGCHKLIWYPVGNRFQLFDLEDDPQEMHDLAADSASCGPVAELKEILLGNLYGSDLEKWVQDGMIVGEPDREWVPQPERGLLGQRGWR